jgi:hypothetical protein
MIAHRPVSRAHSTTDATPVLRWVFQRENDTITCEVDAAGANRYEVSVVPHWNIAAAFIEEFDAPLSALCRHADIARRLRDTGWNVVDYTSFNGGDDAPARVAA